MRVIIWWRLATTAVTWSSLRVWNSPGDGGDGGGEKNLDSPRTTAVRGFVGWEIPLPSCWRRMLKWEKSNPQDKVYTPKHLVHWFFSFKKKIFGKKNLQKWSCHQLAQRWSGRGLQRSSLQPWHWWFRRQLRVLRACPCMPRKSSPRHRPHWWERCGLSPVYMIN